MDPEQLRNDKDFMAASPADQHAYLMSVDKDYAAASPADQRAYRAHLGIGPKSSTVPAQQVTPEEKAAMQSAGSAVQYSLGQFGQGVADVAKGFGQLFDPRVGSPTEQKIADYAGPGGVIASRMGRGIYDLGKQALHVPGAVRDIAASPDALFHLGMQGPRVGGEAAGQLATAGAMKAIPKAVSAAGEAIRPIAPEEAITEGLGVPTKSKLMQGAIRDVRGAKPYLGGRTAAGELPTQADIQARIPGAKQEIFKPIEDAIEQQKDRPVTHEGERTTVKELQNRRNELSAQRSKLTKNLSPQQLAETRATGEGKLVNLDSQLESIDRTLDPVIRETGIDPAAIRRQYGAVKGIERHISGRSTVTEPTQAYGLRKLVPFKAPGALGVPEWQWKPIEGIRDIRSGQLFSGKPTDVGMGRIFGEAGEKPNLGTPSSPRVTDPTRLLGPGPRMMPSAMEPIGSPSAPQGLLPYQPSLQRPPAFVRPGEIRPAGTMELLPPAEGGMFSHDIRARSSAEDMTPMERRTAADTAADIRRAVAKEPSLAEHEANMRQRAAEAQAEREALGPYPRANTLLDFVPENVPAPGEEGVPRSYDRFGRLRQ